MRITKGKPQLLQFKSIQVHHGMIHTLHNEWRKAPQYREQSLPYLQPTIAQRKAYLVCAYFICVV